VGQEECQDQEGEVEEGHRTDPPGEDVLSVQGANKWLDKNRGTKLG